MISPNDGVLRRSIERYCVQVGGAPMLTQAAGGNVSWKEGDSLFVKASGKWLAHAEREEIFVRIKISDGLKKIEQASDDFASLVASGSLRPSIETSMHLLMPHKLVSHIHAVDVICWSLRKDAAELLKEKLGGLSWIYIPYVKPGLPLTLQLKSALQGRKCDVVILGNHGLVLGADSVPELTALQNEVLQSLRCDLNQEARPGLKESKVQSGSEDIIGSFRKHPDSLVQALAFKQSIDDIKNFWALYPDHIVFLGPHAIVQSLEELRTSEHLFAIVPDQGFFVHERITEAQLAMLSCFADVFFRIHDFNKIQCLTESDINDLLNWDAEKYRQGLQGR